VFKKIFTGTELHEMLTRIEERKRKTKRKNAYIVARYYVKIIYIYALIITTIVPVDDANPWMSDLEKHLGLAVALKIDDEIKASIDPVVSIVSMVPMVSMVPVLANNLPFDPTYLYFDTDYDSATNEFLGMHPETKKKYENDLKTFHHYFTDGTSAHAHALNHFSNINLTHYSDAIVSDADADADTLKEEDLILFGLYGLKMKLMMQSIKTKQTNLMDILNSLFMYTSSSSKKAITIDPKVKAGSLKKIISTTRSEIIELHSICKKYTKEIHKIQEAIVEYQTLLTVQNQIAELKHIYYKLRLGTQYE
jgi:hypothetical protein